MGATKNYRVLRGKISRPEKDGARKVYREGDVIEMTKQEARYHKDRIQLYTGPVVSDEDEDDEDEDNDESVNSGKEDGTSLIDWTSALSEMSANDAIKTIAQLDSATEVASIKAVEQSMAKPRRSVLEAADNRMAEINSK